MQLVFLRLSFAISLLAILVAVVGCSLASHPSDQVLEQRLQSHRADFDKLVNMLDEDSDIVRLDNKYVFLNGSSDRTVPKERLDEYRSLFTKLGLEGGIHRDKPEAIRLIASTKGMFFPTSEKSYVHSTTEFTQLVDSLDDIVERNRGGQSPVYKKVFGNWYLYYESW